MPSTRPVMAGRLANRNRKGYGTLNTHWRTGCPLSIGQAASSQNQAFNALLFLFPRVLEKPFEKVEGIVSAKKKPYIPVMLSRQEVDLVISHLAYPYDLVTKLLHGCGLRLFECL